MNSSKDNYEIRKIDEKRKRIQRESYSQQNVRQWKEFLSI